MNLVALPAFSDNYIWMLHDGQQALVVDPGDSVPVLAALDAGGLELSGILVTHHHADHVGGLQGLRGRLKGHVHGPAAERIPEPFDPYEDGEVLSWNGLNFQVLEVPGHTAGHIAWFLPRQSEHQAPVLFCGDTLFSGGCGRLFEGSPAQMLASLTRLAELPGDTRVCCAHEYTLANLRFALAVEPHNADLQAYQAHCQALRARGEFTLPSRIELERRINPFLRCDVASVRSAARQQGASSDEPLPVFTALRAWKNHFQ